MSRVRRRRRVFSRTLLTSARPCATASEPCSTDAVDRLVCFTSTPRVSFGVRSAADPSYGGRPKGASDLRPRGRAPERRHYARCTRRVLPVDPSAAIVRGDGQEEAPARDQGGRAGDRRDAPGSPAGRRVPGGPGRGGCRRVPGRPPDDLRLRARRPHALAPAVPRDHRVLRAASVPRRRRQGRGRPARPGRRRRDPGPHVARLPREAGARADGTAPAAAHRGPAAPRRSS